MDTLYVLCRSVDHRYSHAMPPAEVEQACTQKTAYFEAEAKVNPLVQEILTGGTVSFDELPVHDTHGFLAGPATFFRTHEILRKTRNLNTPLTIGDDEYTHDEVAAMFSRCVPNAKMTHLPWCSLGRLRISLGLAWAVTLMAAHFTARGEEGDALFDPFVLYYTGSITTVIALAYTILKQNRDFRHVAPWNSAMYLDLNADLVRRRSPYLPMAREEFVPQERPLKTPQFYYALARKIETQGLDAELQQELSACKEAVDAASFLPHARP
ncbi:MAG: hypothetical protein ABIZ04_22565 [Opitutus sp.]